MSINFPQPPNLLNQLIALQQLRQNQKSREEQIRLQQEAMVRSEDASLLQNVLATGGDPRKLATDLNSIRGIERAEEVRKIQSRQQKAKQEQDQLKELAGLGAGITDFTGRTTISPQAKNLFSQGILGLGIQGNPEALNALSRGVLEERSKVQQEIAKREPKLRRVLDSQTGQEAFVRDAQIFESPGRFRPLLAAGEGEAQGLTKTTVNNLQKEILADADSLGRLNFVINNFSPEVFSLSGRGEISFAKLKDRLGGNLSQRQRDLIEKADIARDIIAELRSGAFFGRGGANLTAREIEFLGPTTIDPNSGPFTVLTELKRVRNKMATIQMRRVLALSEGVDINQLAFGNVDRIARKKLSEIEKQVIAENPGAGDAEIDRIFNNRVVEFFGFAPGGE
jgi:hypothetical protein